MLKRDLIRNVIIALIAVVMVVILRLYVLTPYQVKAQDENLVLSAGDHILAYRLEEPERDDLVLYEVDGKTYIGRVIGKSKDYVASMDNVLYVNHEAHAEAYLLALKENYLNKTENAGYFTEDFTLETLTQSDMKEIPDGQFLILNDNRRNNKDSRSFGLIKKNQIEGVVGFRLSPLSKFGFLKNN
ncbi:Signal peptidase I [Streptococcus sp. DD10]|uniref:signal peptidase I n=1 Tax=Streptococcus sp. DD10 TaxID=1777878 RepID=UPI000792EA6B|nr:signal peptidase I [Streptococcus sp. DD10]KXT73806.1 Signal peptidase I [Streptococcus sp. DD10]